jgi:hypothetical protein
MDLQVIGAGFGRTGTSSLRDALNILGFGPCYHMSELFKSNDVDKWMRPEKAWENIFAPQGKLSYKSTVDHPSCLYYKELFDLNPNSKVILTVRDSSSVWYESVKETIFIASVGMKFPMNILKYIIPAVKKIVHMVDLEVWGNSRLFDGKFEDQNRTEKVYLNWIKEVENVIPKSKLLIFNVKEGWDPLCNFLGVPVPDCSFPRVNDRKEFLSIIRKQFFVTTVFILLSGICIGRVLYMIYETAVK